MQRAYFQATIAAFCNTAENSILGELALHHNHDLSELQRNAWLAQIKHLKETFVGTEGGYIFFEFSIPRMGKRADVVLLIKGNVFVLEYKVGSDIFDTYAKRQVLDYALDLKNFHEGSHKANIVPILIATNATNYPQAINVHEDGLSDVLCVNARGLGNLIQQINRELPDNPIDEKQWSLSLYKPTPTIIEAAQYMYRGHDVEEISRSDAGASNLTETTKVVNEIIDKSKAENSKSICFITGVPGAGKTLAGLNIATDRMNIDEDEHAVFLSGNGPLVDVLREALALDEWRRAKENNASISKIDARRKTKTFIQNIHHFRDDNLQTASAPIEKVAIFDEAQRAWDEQQTTSFMRQKKGIEGFNMSEPEFLLSVMDRHDGWCSVVCLIGGGQEINKGEAGLTEWVSALKNNFPDWNIYYSDKILGGEYNWQGNIQDELESVSAKATPGLHLATSLRSFRADNQSIFINHLMSSETEQARHHLTKLSDYPIEITRDLSVAKNWLRKKTRGSERAGIIASSSANRLKSLGINIKDKIKPTDWFLSDDNDVRSSSFLEDAATEFDIQGLELDWACVCWEGDLRRKNNKWAQYKFKGTKWQQVNNEYNKRYLLNAYRVLLTRARQGLIIFVPEGDLNDLTRPPLMYDEIYEYLKSLGLKEIS